MENILKSINAILGVIGSFVCDRKGQVLTSAMPNSLDERILLDVGRTISQTLSGLATTHRRKIDDIDLVYGQGRFIIKNLGEGYLCILCVRNINVALLNMTANMAAKKLAKMVVELKEKGMQEGKIREARNLRSLMLNAEVHSIISTAREQGVVLQAAGDTAIRLHCPSAGQATLQLEEVMDLVGHGKQATATTRILGDLGYSPERRFNLLQGGQRLRFIHPEKHLGIEVFLDSLNMYHQLNLADRLDLKDDTIPLADLLLWKLQYVDPDEEILRAIYTIVSDHELGGPEESEKIDTARILDLCAKDWGWFKTVTINLEKSITWAERDLGFVATVFLERARRLLLMIKETPKSGGWQLRARIGESRRWYEIPE